MMHRSVPPSTGHSRRRFLQQLGAVSALAALGGCRSASDQMSTPSASPGSPPASTGAATSPGRLLPGAVEGRVLVVVDLRGGNDGLSTLVPAGSGRYYDLRPDLAVPDEDVLSLDDEVGLHPALGRLHKRGITTVEGVGPIDGDLSHFAMVERWERGDADGSAHQRSGFLGRLTDALDDGSPLVGVSLDGPTPHLGNEVAATMSLGSANDLWFLEPTDWSDALAYQQGVRSFQADGHTLGTKAATSYEMLLDLATDLAASGGGSDVDWDLPMISDGGQIGQQLYLAADLIAADVGTRIIYAGHGDFDTHSGHGWRQNQNLGELDAAVDGFLERADDLGFADKVLVATISEFGRRVAENDGGLDHGSASTMLLAGPVGNDRLGERPPLDDPDDDGNLRVTAGFDRYLATLAERWLGVEASSVLPGEPEPLPL